MQKSHESIVRKTSQQKNVESYLPMRRFSQGIIDSLKHLIDEMEIKDEVVKDDDASDGKLLKEVIKEEEIKSLTGANASGWKFQDSFYGNFNVGRRPSMDTAWGRRIYDQYEMEVEIDKPKYGYLSTKSTIKEPTTLTKRQELRALGVWDVIFDREIVPYLQGAKKWEADHEEKQKALKKLKVDIAKIQDEVVISNKEDPVNKFKLTFCKTGSYLRPDDMRFCVEKTNFTEDQIIDWFKRFRTDCPDGKLTMDHLIKLFKKAFPDGDGFNFSKHIMRIFDSDGNGFLDFKEFLLAIDIATCNTEESRLEWVFKLYDVDNDGIIDVREMAAIMETLECVEYKDCSLFSSPNFDSISALERAQNLFNCIEHENENTLTKEEFIAGYLERNVLMEKQDAQEQKLRLDSLVFRGPLIPDPGEIQEKQLPTLVEKLLNDRCLFKIDSQVDCQQIQLRGASEFYPKNIMIKFSHSEMRDEIWNLKTLSKKNGLIIEEWLTETRSKLYKRCKELKSAKLIKDCFTDNGNIFAKVQDDLLIINTDSAFDSLVKMTKFDLDDD